jgi:hypothetical protein
MQMTKKEQREAEVLENKKAAYVKKVRGLLGHVFDRQSAATIAAAFEAGVSAEDYSTSIAAKEPVGLCIHPMKIEAVDSMEKKVRERIEKLLAKLAEHGGDIYKAFPYDEDFRNHSDDNKQATNLHNFVCRLSVATDELIEIRKWGVRNYKRVPHAEGIERVVQENRDIASFTYDMFICKMVHKVGPGVDSASIEGSHVWGYSILTVKKGDVVERWHTQTIWNTSKYGLPFNQWPSRKMK